MRYLKRLARRYPMQTFLFLFNAGVFTWLQTTGTMIANRLGLSGEGIWIYIPNWVKTLTSHSIAEYSNPIRGLWLELANHLYASHLALDFSERSHESSDSHSDSWSWLMASLSTL